MPGQHKSHPIPVSSRFNDHIGERFGERIIVAYGGRKKRKKKNPRGSQYIHLWEWECSCGRRGKTVYQAIKKSVKCGECLWQEMKSPAPNKGEKVNDFEFVSRAASGQWRWKCINCGYAFRASHKCVKNRKRCVKCQGVKIGDKYNSYKVVEIDVSKVPTEFVCVCSGCGESKLIKAPSNLKRLPQKCPSCSKLEKAKRGKAETALKTALKKAYPWQASNSFANRELVKITRRDKHGFEFWKWKCKICHRTGESSRAMLKNHEEKFDCDIGTCDCDAPKTRKTAIGDVIGSLVIISIGKGMVDCECKRCDAKITYTRTQLASVRHGIKRTGSRKGCFACSRKRYLYEGKPVSMQDVSDMLGISEKTAHGRLQTSKAYKITIGGEKELSPLVALFRFNIAGAMMTAREVEETFGTPKFVFLTRIQHGATPLEAAVRPERKQKE